MGNWSISNTTFTRCQTRISPAETSLRSSVTV